MCLAHGLDEVVEIALGEQIGRHGHHRGAGPGQGFGILAEALTVGQLGDRIPEGFGAQQFDVLAGKGRQLLQRYQPILGQGGAGSGIEQAETAEHQPFGGAQRRAQVIADVRCTPHHLEVGEACVIARILDL